MVARDSLSPELIVRAAVAHVDQHGLESLTMRALGEELGAHFTALYRHFRNKDELLSAMFEMVISEIASEVDFTNPDPLARIRSVALAFRKSLHKHPALVGTIVSTRGTEATFRIQRQIASDMLKLGVPKELVAVKYQALESYVFGAAMFDYLGAPNHLDHRLERYKQVRDGIFDTSVSSQKSVDTHNEKAFAAGLEAILSSFK
jgi:AcrR family transcriptional regulator